MDCEGKIDLDIMVLIKEHAQKGTLCKGDYWATCGTNCLKVRLGHPVEWRAWLQSDRNNRLQLFLAMKYGDKEVRRMKYWSEMLDFGKFTAGLLKEVIK